MRKLPLRNRAVILKIINEFEDYDYDYICQFVDNCERLGYTQSKTVSHTRLISDIMKTNSGKNYGVLYNEYWISKGRKERIGIRYGGDVVCEYTIKLKNRPRPQIVSHLTINYWVKKGYTIEEAKKHISKIQTKNANNRSDESYKDYKYKVKWSSHYWISRGYSPEESEILKLDYLQKNDLNGMIELYGEEDGLKRYIDRVEKYTNSMKDSCGSRRAAGYVSKESLKFFIPLYKKLRRLGIGRSDIYFGIDGSREFFVRRKMHKNCGRFVDFCIPSLKIVIEYHGCFWHWREDLHTDGHPLLDVDQMKRRDEDVKLLAIDRGFNYITVWSDDNLPQKINEIYEYIREVYNNG